MMPSGQLEQGKHGPPQGTKRPAVDLSLALVSADAQLTTTLQRITAELHAPLSHFNDVNDARAELSRLRFGGIIIDCDESPASRALLASIPKLPANRVSPILAILNGGTNASDARDMGAKLTLDKPVTPDAARRALRELRALSSPDQRRFPRHRVKLPAYVSFGNTIDRLATMFNLSEGGVGLTAVEPIPLDEIVSISFQLPSGPRLRAMGEVAWCDANGNAGLRFLSISRSTLNDLRTWMDRHLETRT